MPTRTESVPPEVFTTSLATTRILRLAFGTALSLWVSQAIGWSLSFIAPVVTMFILAMPFSRPPPKVFIGIVVALTASIYGSFVFLPMLLNQRLAGLLLLSLALFHSFYFTARGGAAAVGTLVTVGMALTVGIGTVSVDALLAVAGGLAVGAAVGAFMAMLSHLIIPDRLAPSAPVAAPPKDTPVDLAIARHNALRSLAIVMPILIWFVLSGASASYAPVMIKVAAMGQEVTQKSTRDAARSLIISTLVGGLAAVIAWQFLTIWPSLTMYVLAILLAGLFFGRRVFKGDGLHADAETWSYGFLTMIVILAPAVLDSASGDAAGAGFTSRLLMFLGATVYAVVMVNVFDAFWKNPGEC